MCKKLIVLVLSLCVLSSAGADTVIWDFENGNDHLFDLWSVNAGWPSLDDPTIAGDEALTGAGGAVSLPDNGVAWTVGPPNQFDGQKPVVEEGCHVVNGVLEYGPCNDPFKHDDNNVNARGQSGYLNTYNLNQWGDNLHIAANDQIATSPSVTLGPDSVLTVWSLGGGSSTHAPAYDAVEVQMYTDGSSGIAVLSAEEADKYALLASLHTQGQGTLTEDTLDLSALAGKRVFIEVVDAFAGSWGFLAIDEIRITDATSKNAVFVCQPNSTDGTLTGGYDAVQVERLESLGYNVRIVDQVEIDDTFTVADSNDYDLLIISETPGSSATVSLKTTSAPFMHQEAYGWPEGTRWDLSEPRDDEVGNILWLAGSEVDIVNDTHPIVVNAGLSAGTVPFFDPPNSWTTQMVGGKLPDAELIATANDAGSDYMIIFAFETGSELADGRLSTNRIVAFSLPGLFESEGGPFAADTMTDEAWALYDAAIAWLDPPPAPPAAAMIVNDITLPNGFDAAQKDRLESLGYTVTLATGADVSDGVFTAADAEAFDVLVVSESIGSSEANNLIGANVPMMHQESYGWSRHFFTQGLAKAWLNDPNGMVEIVDGAHQIVTDAGLAAGDVQFFANPAASWTTDSVESLVAGAVNVAQALNADGVANTIIFTIEAGTELADASLAANRVCCFSIPGNESYVAADMTDDAWALFDAAIAWLDQ